MINKKVLIVNEQKDASSRYISEISDEIAKILVQRGFITQIIDLGKTSKKKWPLISDYDAVLLGTWSIVKKLSFGIKEFPPRPLKFLRNNEPEFHKRKIFFGLFVSDPHLIKMIEDPVKIKEELELIIKTQLPITPDIYDLFGPVINIRDLSGYEKDRCIDLLRRISKRTGSQIDYNGINDFRNWNQIRDFALKFAELKEELEKDRPIQR